MKSPQTSVEIPVEDGLSEENESNEYVEDSSYPEEVRDQSADVVKE